MREYEPGKPFHMKGGDYQFSVCITDRPCVVVSVIKGTGTILIELEHHSEDASPAE